MKMRIFIFLLISIPLYSQSISKVQIIYESKKTKEIVMNDGQYYTIIEEIPSYQIQDQSLANRYTVQNQLFFLYRIIWLKRGNETKELIEWKSNQQKSYYKYRKVQKFIPENQQKQWVQRKPKRKSFKSTAPTFSEHY